jgi:hypothetical protein
MSRQMDQHIPLYPKVDTHIQTFTQCLLSLNTTDMIFYDVATYKCATFVVEKAPFQICLTISGTFASRERNLTTRITHGLTRGRNCYTRDGVLMITCQDFL